MGGCPYGGPDATRLEGEPKRGSDGLNRGARPAWLGFGSWSIGYGLTLLLERERESLLAESARSRFGADSMRR